jgi:hypothetical protein
VDGYGKGSETPGQKAYDSYRLRARFPNFVREAVQMAIGMMHSQPADISLPEEMTGITSSRGETLQQLLRRINTEQLITGRVGILVDIPIAPRPGEDLPYLAIYSAEKIVNWDNGKVEELVPQKLNMVVLDESEYERNGNFDWTKEEKYRVLSLGAFETNEPSGSYAQGVMKVNVFNLSLLRTPTWRGRELDFIPFTFINSCDLVSDVDDPPLLDLGNICMAIYRGEADYRHNLFMQGQDTFVTIGAGITEEDVVRIGAGSRIDLPPEGDAKYVGVNSNGLSEQREALKQLESRAGSMGAQTLDTVSRERESGDSLRIRVAARTADLNQIADTGAAGLEESLKMIAVWMGLDPEQVKVVPNKEFGESVLSGQSMVEMATARNLGFPISAKSLHDLARTRRLTKFTFEEEIAQAKKEAEGEDFVFAKVSTGDRASEQTNSDPNNENRGTDQPPPGRGNT